MVNYMPTLAELPMVHLFLSPEVPLKYFWHLAESQCCYVIRCSEPPESQPTDYRITLDSGGTPVCLESIYFVYYTLNFMNQVEAIFKITTALRYGHLNLYQSEQPHCSKVCLLSQNKIYWALEGVKNIDLGWFWLCRVVWCRRLQKIVFKMAKDWVKTNCYLQD